MAHLKTTLRASVVCAALLATLPAGALAASRHQTGSNQTGTQAGVKHQTQSNPGQHLMTGRRSIAFGTLTTLSNTSATITTPSKDTVTVSLTTNTRYVPRSAAARAAGNKTGDQVAAYGRSVNGLQARILAYDTKPFAVASLPLRGTVSSSASGSLTLTLANGKSVTVQLTSQTRFLVNRQVATTAPTFAAKQPVVVIARAFTDGTYVARIVATRTTA